VKDPFGRVRIGLGAFALVIIGGILGFLALGLDLIDAVYQTVVTITTVGASTPKSLLSTTGKVFTIVLILVGVGTALYTFSVVLELLIEGHMRELVRRRRMDRAIAGMSGHVVICGWGRVGQEVSRFLANAGRSFVVIDRDAERLSGISDPNVHGDVTDDETLVNAGIERASTLVAALDTDADNLFVTLASRSMRPDLQIIARARSESSVAKLRRAGTDRVVNPQQIGGGRMAAFVTQPHVVDFVDVVMHDGTLEFRLEEFAVSELSPLMGRTLRSAQLRDRTGALVLAIRRPDNSFVTNPSPEAVIELGDVLISVGTEGQLQSLASFVGRAAEGSVT
jgi:voltage-gated potassium channel